MKWIILFVFIILWIFSVPVRAEKMRIAVLDLKEEGISKQTAKTVTNMLRIELIKIGRFTVIERSQMDMILKEQGLQQTGCTDQECAVQLGKIMSAQKMLIGEVSPMGKSIIMTVRIVDVEKGISDYAAREKAASEDDLDSAVGRISEKLVAQIEKGVGEAAEREEKPGEITAAGYYARGIVPGWGQSYAGHTMRGIVYLGAFLAAGSFWVYSHLDYTSKRDDYDNLPAGTSNDVFDSKHKAYEDAGQMAYIALGIFGFAYTANWVDILFFSKPNFNTSISFNKQDKIFINFNAVSNENSKGELYLLSVCMRY